MIGIHDNREDTRYDTRIWLSLLAQNALLPLSLVPFPSLSLSLLSCPSLVSPSDVVGVVSSGFCFSDGVAIPSSSISRSTRHRTSSSRSSSGSRKTGSPRCGGGGGGGASSSSSGSSSTQVSRNSRSQVCCGLEHVRSLILLSALIICCSASVFLIGFSCFCLSVRRSLCVSLVLFSLSLFLSSSGDLSETIFFSFWPLVDEFETRPA